MVTIKSRFGSDMAVNVPFAAVVADPEFPFVICGEVARVVDDPFHTPLICDAMFAVAVTWDNADGFCEVTAAWTLVCWVFIADAIVAEDAVFCSRVVVWADALFLWLVAVVTVDTDGLVVCRWVVVWIEVVWAVVVGANVVVGTK